MFCEDSVYRRGQENDLTVLVYSTLKDKGEGRFLWRSLKLLLLDTDALY